jgi:hypothetical protein
MKKLFIIAILISLLPLNIARMETGLGSPTGAAVERSGDKATVTWQNPADPAFTQTVLFRSPIPIENYFSYEAVNGLCDKIYEGRENKFQDSGLAVNLPYYYILFAQDKIGSSSRAVVLTAKVNSKDVKKSPLAGAPSETVNEVSYNEAGIVFNYNRSIESEMDDTSKRLSLFIIVRSPHDLSTQDKNAISFFIHEGTQTTILLGTGERAGVLNSYLSVFNKLPNDILEWQDIIKIANGRWPDERNVSSEEQAANTYFSAIYARKPDMNDANDNAAVTVIAYGLRPAARNLESEKNAINIFRSIFDRSPANATDWDLVRAIAYSGATR